MEYNLESMLINIKELLDQIDKQIAAVTKQARRMDIAPYEMRNPDGSWTFANLLPAKAQLLSTYVILMAKQERKQSWIQPHREH